MNIALSGIIGEEFELDPSVFGHRLRHLRAARGITLKELGDVVGRQPAFLSQLENGKREANLSLINALARALKVTPAELLDTSPPSRRAELEIALERVQLEPLYRDLGLQVLKPSARLPTGALEHIVRLADELKRRAHVRAQTPEEARKGNAALRREMRERDNYFDYIEEVAANALDQVDYPGAGAVSRRILDDLAAYFGFTVRTAPDLPQSLRSLTDLRSKTIYIRTRDESGPQVGRSVVFQTLGHFALGHEDPRDFGEFLRQRVEANYFAGAMLLPERAVAPFLAESRRDGDLAIEDLEERFYVSYEMAAHRFTNLATHHLGIPVHFVRSDEEGIIWKAYENDGLPLPADPDGAIEGQRLCRHWGAREAFRETGSFSMHYQYTDTPAGTYWFATYLEAERERKHAITVGTSYDHARFFRGSDTHRRARSSCPDGPCCRRPPATLAARWDGYAWPSPSPHSHVLAAMPAGTFPGVDLSDAYEFLERQTTE